MSRVITTRPLVQQVMRRAAEHLVPIQVTAELTYRCNLRCHHCYVDRPTGEELSLAEWTDVFDQLAAAGGLYLLLTGGEVTARKDFLAIAWAAKQRGFLLALLTNATLLTDELLREIAALRPFGVGVSLHGATAATHDRVTGREGSFAATLRGARRLRELGVRVSAQATLMESNVSEAGAMRALAIELGIGFRLSQALTPTKTGSCEPLCHEPAFDMVVEHVDPAWLGLAGEPEPREAGPCGAGRAACSIAPSGDVYPCVMMPLKLGNLRQTSFADLWHRQPNPDLRQLRGLTRADMLECRNCGLAAYCARCMAIALAETGDLSKASPSACRHATHRMELRRMEVFS